MPINYASLILCVMCKRVDMNLLLALDLGPQLGSGFSGNLVNLSSRDGGLASVRISKDASNLQKNKCKTIRVGSEMSFSVRTGADYRAYSNMRYL